MIVFWFRRDLRIEDNTALFHAFQEKDLILPIFIFDKTILSPLPKEDARVSFIHQKLQHIQNQLKVKGKSLAIFYAHPLDVFQELIKTNSIQAVYCNRDYEPSARKRDKTINELLMAKNIAFKTCKDQVVFEKSEIVKEDGGPYVVYTPYSKKWKAVYRLQTHHPHPSEKYIDKIVNHKYPFLSLSDIGFTPTKISLPNFNISKQLVENYEQNRNFPALVATSLLGIHLRFGSVSIRNIVHYAATFKNEIFLNELIWREFFMQILWHYPHTIEKSFKPKYDFIQWENNKEFFQKWCKGETGYPIVDAGMRELNATGHMHNRVRMVVASFLCKHLLIDWKWGEAYFALKLLDYEQASNVGNWQWVAGSGVDAAPYFRIFNPIEQMKKFDKDYTYIKKWIPEWQTGAYPIPIIEHKMARERCIAVYKKAVG